MLDWSEFGFPDDDISVLVLRIGYGVSDFDSEPSSYLFGKGNSEIRLYSTVSKYFVHDLRGDSITKRFYLVKW